MQPTNPSYFCLGTWFRATEPLVRSLPGWISSTQSSLSTKWCGSALAFDGLGTVTNFYDFSCSPGIQLIWAQLLHLRLMSNSDNICKIHLIYPSKLNKLLSIMEILGSLIVLHCKLLRNYGISTVKVSWTVANLPNKISLCSYIKKTWPLI